MAGTARYSRSATGPRSPRPCSPAAAGVASHHTNPWLTLDDGAADEEHGEAWGTALPWSGSRRITVHRDPVGRTTRTGGFGHEGLSRTIQPGQSLRTPVFACLCTPGGFNAASRAWHTHIRTSVLPAPDQDRPVVCNLWEATGFGVGGGGGAARPAPRRARARAPRRRDPPPPPPPPHKPH
ncbi:glycoside hydrolase family 36 N-terminal domain-containing protein, partial [Streptomyces sp. NPDC059616]|uniref:glycoside hydrolase family 36 N-terminal domain-containing protein n=1 Tax=Streptomyces sp. NPDC059616 TaxID=3346886 RepID=UPI0036BAFB9F